MLYHHREEHVELNQPECSFVCERIVNGAPCAFVAPTYKSLKKHISRVHGRIVYTCPECNMNLWTRTDLEQHNRRFHPTKKATLAKSTPKCNEDTIQANKSLAIPSGSAAELQPKFTEVNINMRKQNILTDAAHTTRPVTSIILAPANAQIIIRILQPTDDLQQHVVTVKEECTNLSTSSISQGQRHLEMEPKAREAMQNFHIF